MQRRLPDMRRAALGRSNSFAAAETGRSVAATLGDGDHYRTSDQRTMTLPASIVTEHLYRDHRAMILVLAGVGQHVLEQRAFELGLHYDTFLSTYAGPYLGDSHVGFAAMLRAWPTPWPGIQGSVLNGVSVVDFYLAWSWSENDAAQRYSTEANAGATDAAHDAVVTAVSAAKSLAYAKSILANGSDGLAQSYASIS